MPTRQDVLAALGPDFDYAAAAERLGIHPGLAHLIATGLPADGSDALTEEEAKRYGLLSGSSQHLSNPPAHKSDAHDVVSRWLLARTQRDSQMRQAALSRTATPAPIHDEDGDTDLITVLVRQHDQVVALVKQLDTIPGRSKGGDERQASQRESIVDMISEMLAAHETAEEEHLWPHVRRLLADGEDWASEGLAQEQQATETLLALAKADPQAEDFDHLVEQLMPQLHKHVALEDRLFRQLHGASSDDERQQLGRKVLAAQKHAPTRPHPHAPRHPGSVVAAAAKSAVPLDAARDASGRPADREGRPDDGPQA
jgi:hemerythrin HHE cation binding domain-containing protein